jgi:hypothetical protein
MEETFLFSLRRAPARSHTLFPSQPPFVYKFRQIQEVMVYVSYLELFKKRRFRSIL